MLSLGKLALLREPSLQERQLVRFRRALLREQDVGTTSLLRSREKLIRVAMALVEVGNQGHRRLFQSISVKACHIHIALQLFQAIPCHSNRMSITFPSIPFDSRLLLDDDLQAVKG